MICSEFVLVEENIAEKVFVVEKRFFIEDSVEYMLAQLRFSNLQTIAFLKGFAIVERSMNNNFDDLQSGRHNI